jgi:hypothetical protein
MHSPDPLNGDFLRVDAEFSGDPDGLTAHYFLTNTKKYLREGVPKNWTGAEEMMSK